MAGSFISTPYGAEISGRSSELVLPDRGEDERSGSPIGVLRGKEIGVSESRGTTQHATSSQGRDGAASSESASAAGGASGATGAQQGPGGRGAALPGDRGPRLQESAQRPSFWRRIALGRRSAEPDPSPPRAERQASPSSVAPTDSTRAVGRGSLSPSHGSAVATPDSIERRIVEPMLQALVSVEAKLERSHTELVGRSDQVEQRLTQLWDIEEQLGTLSELQESLLQVSEQQRRLESAVVSQTRTLRWLVGAVFVSLAAAAFVVAAILR